MKKNRYLKKSRAIKGGGVSSNIDPNLVARTAGQNPGAAGTSGASNNYPGAQQGSPFHVNSVSDNGWFGPLQPLNPIAQEQAHGRQFDYPVGYNNRIRPKDDSPISYEQLRALSENLDILRLVIESRKEQVESFKWDIVEKDGKQAKQSDIDKVKEFFEYPMKGIPFASWLRMILEDIFVIDAVAIEPQYTRGGELYALNVIDGSTIKRVIDDKGHTPEPPDVAYGQILKGVPATYYTADELIFVIRNMRSNKIYGYSPVEQIIMTINIALRRQLVQLQHYTEGNIPEALIGVPETWNPDQVAQFQTYFNSMLESDASKRKLTFIPMDASKIHETRTNVGIKDLFDEWLARVVCYAFSVTSAPFVAQMNRATAESAANQAEQEGLAPLLAFLKRLIDTIIKDKMGIDNIEFTWKLKSATSPLEQAQIDKIYVESGIMDSNEIRENLGLEDKDDTQIVQDQSKTVINTQTVQDNKEPKQESNKEENVKENEAVKEAAKKMDEAMDMMKKAMDFMIGQQDLMKAMATAIGKELPTPVVNVTTGETIVNLKTPTPSSNRTIVAKRNADGSLSAEIEDK